MTTYELWDVEVGNLLGEFATLEESLAIVGQVIESYGSAAGATLQLLRRQEDGVATTLAVGAEVVALMRQGAKASVG